MNSGPLTEVRDNLREVVDSKVVEQTGNEFVITRRGKPVAVVLGLMMHTRPETVSDDDAAMAAIRAGEAELAEDN